MKRIDHHKELLKQIKRAETEINDYKLMDINNLSRYALLCRLSCGRSYIEFYTELLGNDGNNYEVTIIRTEYSRKRWAVVTMVFIGYHARLVSLPVLCSTLKEAHSVLDGIVIELEVKNEKSRPL